MKLFNFDFTLESLLQRKLLTNVLNVFMVANISYKLVLKITGIFWQLDDRNLHPNSFNNHGFPIRGEHHKIFYIDNKSLRRLPPSFLAHFRLTYHKSTNAKA